MLKLLFLTLNAAKFGKALAMVGSMLLMMVTYGLLFGWTFAIGVVGLLVAFSAGNYQAAKYRGLTPSLPLFIPFIGTWSLDRHDAAHNAELSAFVALGGTCAGFGAATLCTLAGFSADSTFFLALGYTGLMLTLWNLFPITPFPGGNIVGVVSPKIWFFAFPVLIGLFFVFPSPMLLVIALLSAPVAWRAWKLRHEAPDYFAATPGTRKFYAVAYLLLVVATALALYALFQNLSQRLPGQPAKEAPTAVRETL